ncbi:STS14 protein-like [Lotus japonicus]|uniref:STS14 protein-like n=1 Tax=Lotus japonicus TaxID=34305 RepID=UPI002583E51C|nr:STS14 protein-like [Lotus japonicus]
MFPHPFFAVLVALALLLVSSQATPATTDGAKVYLFEHNFVRREKGISEHLEWSDKLAKDASLYARFRRDKYLCTPGIFDKKRYGVGCNQWLEDSVKIMDPREVMRQWVKDRFYYNEGNNSCVPANYPCGDYTQIVWRKTKYLGCAQAECGPDYGGVRLNVCFYYPPGNVPGERPY